MALFNNDERVSNISYINKDFQALWQELLELVPKFTDKWDPSKANESDPLAVLLKLLAIYSDKLNYNIDKNVLENFPQTLTQIRSAYNVYDTLGYNPPWYNSANADLALFYDGFEYTVRTSSTGTEEAAEIAGTLPTSGANIVINADGDTITLKKFTQFSNEDNSQIYTSVRDISFANGTSVTMDVPVIEGTINDFVVGGSKKIVYRNLNAENKLFFTEPNVAEDGIFISFSEDFANGSTEFQKVNNIYQNISTDACYEFGIDPVTGACYIQFSDSIGSLIQDGIYIKYILSNGENGNVAANTINTFYQLSDENITNHIAINNTTAITSGKNPATIDEMYLNYKKVQGTFDTLVTLKDFEDFLYLYTNADGNNIVSNIRVSDRYSDLFDSYRVYKQSVEEENDILLPKVETKTENGQTTPLMTASDLRFYPLESSTNVSTLADYNRTFNVLTNDSHITNNIASAVDSVKALNYDMADPSLGKPIEVPFTLNGQVYLKSQVSEEDGKQVINNMKTAFYQNFNARQLEFGREIDYQNLIDVLTNSDSRIAYIALNPIEYSSIDFDKEGTDEKPLSNSEITKRAVMAGVVPWTDYDTSFSFSFGQANGERYSIFPDAGDSTTTITPTLTLKGGSKITLSNSERLRLEQSEDMYLYAPEYKAITTYSNYLYYTYAGETINDATPTKLSAPIQFFYKREDTTPKYIIPENSYVRTNFELKATTGKTGIDTKTIEVIGRNNGALSKAANIDICTNSESLVSEIKGNAAGNYTLKPSEFFMFKDTGKAAITIFYEGTTIYWTITATISDDFEAQTITIDDVVNGKIKDDIWYTVSNNAKNNQLATTLNNPNAKGACWGYLINQILTFGEGIIFRNNNSATTATIKNNVVSFGADSSVEYADDLDNSLDWQALPKLLENDKWQGEVRLFLSVADIESQKLINKNAVTKTENESSITYVAHTQKINISRSDSSTADISPAPTTTDTPITELSVQSNIIIATPGKSITLKRKDYSALIEKGITPQFYTYTINSGKSYQPNRGKFIDFVDKIDDEPIKYVVPGANGQRAVIPFADDSNKIDYWVLESNTSFSKTVYEVKAPISGKISNINTGAKTYTITTDDVAKDYTIDTTGTVEFKVADNDNVVANTTVICAVTVSDNSFLSKYSKIGIPYVVDGDKYINSTYYDTNGGNPSRILISSIITPHKLSVEDYLLDDDYNPTHQVQANNAIPVEELLYGESLFNVNHPANRYTIPKLIVNENGNKLEDTGWNIKISKNSLK